MALEEKEKSGHKFKDESPDENSLLHKSDSPPNQRTLEELPSDLTSIERIKPPKPVKDVRTLRASLTLHYPYNFFS